MKQKLTTTYTPNTKMFSARVPLPLAARVETVVAQAGNLSMSSFVVNALAEAADRLERDLSGAGTEEQPEQ
jgi:hypothetical protein